MGGSKKQKLLKKSGRLFVSAGMGILAFLTVYPAVFQIIGSITGKGELLEGLAPALSGTEGYIHIPVLPLYPTLRAYVEVLLDSPEFFIMFWNSVKLAVGILAGQILISVPAAWGFAKGNFPFRKPLFHLYLLLMMMPFQVLMLPEYLVLDQLRLLDTHMGIILILLFSPFPVFLMYQFFQGIPKEVLEAARLDGASGWQIFLHIGCPLGMPGIASAMILGFLEYWSLIEQPMTFLKTKPLWPLSLYLPDIELSQAGPAFAASVITMVPAILVFLAGQDYLERGIVAAAMKE